MKNKKKTIQTYTCELCRMPYINKEKHDRICEGNPERRGIKLLCELCGGWYFLKDGHDCPQKQSAAIIIARKHQSAPKEHWANKVMRETAQDIVDGKENVSMDSSEFWNYGETQTVAAHPRVKEALTRLETEMEQVRNTQELLEKTAMYHELNERAMQGNKWDGQGRWIGKDNEDMRKGELLTPQEFIRRLNLVVSPERIHLNRWAVMKRVALLAPDPHSKKRESMVASISNKSRDQQIAILRNFEREFSATGDKWKQFEILDAAVKAQDMAKKMSAVDADDFLKGKMQVATLQYPLGTEWMIMRFDDYGVPTSAKFLGWRTALLSMISGGIITEKEAHKAFPLRGDGPASAWYRQQLYEMRGRGVVPA